MNINLQLIKKSIHIRDIPDHTASGEQSPALSCSSSWHGTGRMTGTGKQIHPPCPTTIGLAIAY